MSHDAVWREERPKHRQSTLSMKKVQNARVGLGTSQMLSNPITLTPTTFPVTILSENSGKRSLQQGLPHYKRVGSRVTGWDVASTLVAPTKCAPLGIDLQNVTPSDQPLILGQALSPFDEHVHVGRNIFFSCHFEAPVPSQFS